MCVCKRERERERRKGERVTDTREGELLEGESNICRERERESVCVCVCVCKREREREGEGERGNTKSQKKCIYLPDFRSFQTVTDARVTTVDYLLTALRLCERERERAGNMMCWCLSGSAYRFIARV